MDKSEANLTSKIKSLLPGSKDSKVVYDLDGNELGIITDDGKINSKSLVINSTIKVEDD
jgi:hypothetical protein